MTLVYERSKGLSDAQTHYCPGCTHGMVHKLVAETMVELDIVGNTIGVSSVGCSAFAYDYFACDMQAAAHGRAPAVATGIKRVHPESYVFTYQGDGDLASIGLAEIISAAVRAENITVIFINNAVYGMTGGQMAPTTLIGQRASTAPLGRNNQGYPIKMCEIMAQLEGCVYAERVCCIDVASHAKAKRAVKKAFTLQAQNQGLSFVEVLSTCSTNWGKSVIDAMQWIKTTMTQTYPLGVFKG